MQYHLDIIKQTRANIIKMTEAQSLEVLNQIPEGFNNNLIWNLGHVIVTQQLLCYSLSGNKPVVHSELIAAFRKGTKPEGNIGQGQYDLLKELAYSTLDQFQTDYQEGLFTDYKNYMTSYGIELTSVEEALQFNMAHESMHLGYCQALRRALR